MTNELAVRRLDLSSPAMKCGDRSWADIQGITGRNEWPLLFFEAIASNQLRSGDFTKALCDAWIVPEWPAREGVIVSSSALPETITLWRGALPEYSAGLSWTGDKERAEWFAHRSIHGDLIGQTFEITVPRELVLAHFTEREEDEYVIDIDGLLDEDTE